jgi:oligopeptide transport system substrate-binding protein
MRTVRIGGRRAAGVVVLCLALAMVAGLPAPAQQPAVFRYNFTRDYAGARLDIAKGFTVLGPNLFIGLTRVDPENKVIPGAAERWEVSSDGRTYTFRLRRDLKWTDGRPLTAHDFEFGWKRALNPDTKSQRAWMLNAIVGAEAYNAGQGPADAVGVKALDDFTLQVRLKQPAAYFPTFIAANNVFFAQPRHVIERFGDEWVRPGNIVFSGPFRVTRYVPNSLVVLEPNPLWPLQKPQVARVEYNVIVAPATALAKYEAGELDYVNGLPIGEVPRIRNSPRLREQFVVLPEFRVGLFGMNTKKAPWNNVKVRQAFLRAINAEALTRGPFQGVFKPAFSLRPPEMPGGGLDYVKRLYDPEAARRLLAEAGYPGGRGFPSTAIQMANEEDSRIAAQFLQQQFKQILGVDIRVDVLDTATFLDTIQTGRGESWISAVFSLSPDPYDLYNVAQGSAASNSLWRSTYFQQLLERAAGQRDLAARIRLYDQAERHLVVEHAVMVPLWVTDRTALVSPRVKNLKTDRRSIWLHTWEWIVVE